MLGKRIIEPCKILKVILILRKTVNLRRYLLDVLAEKLDAKLREWKQNTADEVRERIEDIIDLADNGVLDVMRSRSIEQDVLDILDDSERNN